jgi:hypothetical protein
MTNFSGFSLRAVLGTLGIIGFLAVSTAHATTMRIVNWNIEADLNSDSTGTFAGTNYVAPTGSGLPSGGVGAITAALQAIGSLSLGAGAGSSDHPIDVLALEEVGSNTSVPNDVPYTSVAPSATEMNAIVNALNNIYGANTYAYSTVADSVSGGPGGGPSTIIYNTNTVSIVSASSIGVASGFSSPPGAFRAPMQYQIQPVGYSSAAQFYVDVSHMKSGSTSDNPENPLDRNAEAQEIVATSPVTSGAHVISLGDFNITNGSPEATYQTMLTKFADVGDPSNVWGDGSMNTQYAYLESEHGYDVEFRDDLQFVSPSATTNSGSPGIQYDANSYTVLGNFRSSSLYGKNINTQTGTYTFAGLSPSQNAAENADLLQALGGTQSGANDNNHTAASDHLPIVADYDIDGIPTPEPTSLAGPLLATMGLTLRRRNRSGAVQPANSSSDRQRPSPSISRASSFGGLH